MTKSGEYYYKRFLEKESPGKYEEALGELDKAIEVEPNNSDYYLIRGRYRCRRGEFEGAISDLTRVTELSADLDDSVEAYRLLAISHGEIGDLSSLMSDLDWLIENDFATEGTYMRRGYHHRRTGNDQQALQDYTKALEIKPNYEPALINCAQLHYQMQQYDQAEQDLSQIVSMGDQHPNFLKFVYHLRGMTRHQLGKTKGALEDFNEVMRLRGEDTVIKEVSEYLALSSDPSWFEYK